MCTAQFWAVRWLPHLSSGKLVLVIATFLTLVFGLDDLIGPKRTNAWAVSWLSASTRFFTVFIRRVFRSAVMLKILGIASVVTVGGALVVYAAFWCMFVVVSAHQDLPYFILSSCLLSFGIVLVVRLGLKQLTQRLYQYFESEEISIFLHDQSEYLEARIMKKFAAFLSWSAIEEYPDLPRIPAHGVLMSACLPVTLTLILSLVTRTAWLLLSGSVWLLIFAPALALNAVAQRTGAENYIKVGKYVALLIMSIYGLISG